MVIKFDDAPENVRKLAAAIEEATGPSGIPTLEPKAFLAFGERAGLDADSLAAAFRWLAKHYKAHGNPLLRRAAKHFEVFAVALQEAKRVGAS